MHCHPLWIQSKWNSWAAPCDKKIVFALSGTPFQRGAHPDCKCTRGEKRNRTQSLKSLSRHWLIHIWKSDSAFHANKKLLRGRINTKQGVWVFRSEGLQLADKSWTKQSDIQFAELILLKCQHKIVAFGYISVSCPALSLLRSIFSLINIFDIVYFPVSNFKLSVKWQYSRSSQGDSEQPAGIKPSVFCQHKFGCSYLLKVPYYTHFTS